MNSELRFMFERGVEADAQLHDGKFSVECEDKILKEYLEDLLRNFYQNGVEVIESSHKGIESGKVEMELRSAKMGDEMFVPLLVKKLKTLLSEYAFVDEIGEVREGEFLKKQLLYKLSTLPANSEALARIGDIAGKLDELNEEQVREILAILE